MFKIAIISDTHLGFKYGTELGQDAFENFKQAFELALKENPDLFLFPGDIFDEKIPRQEILGDVIDLFKDFRKKHSKKITLIKSASKDKVSEEKKEIPNFISIYGTHERRHSKSTNPVHILEKAGLIYNLHGESVLVQIRSDKLGLHGLSGVPENYARIALQEWNPKAFDGAVNILMLHQNFKELLPQLDTGYIEFADLPAGFDLFILGHIHWNMEFNHPSTKAPILVPGSTVVTQMTKKESEVEKGFYIVDIGREKGNIKFYKIKTRPLYYFEIKSKGLKPSDLYDKVQDVIKKVDMKTEKPQVRIKIKGTLAKGFTSGDVNFKKMLDEYKEKMFISINKSKLLSEESAEISKILEEIKSRKMSAEKIGLELLRENLKTKMSEEDLENIFNFLIEENYTEAEKILNKIIKK